MASSGKIKKLLLAGLLILTALTIWAAPFLLQVQAIHQRLDSALEQSYDFEVEIAPVQFSWLPRPHFQIASSSLENDSVQIKTKEITISPKLKFPWQSDAAIATITINRPQVMLEKWPATVDDNRFQLPVVPAGMNFNLSEGELSIPGKVLPAGYELSSLQFTGIKAGIKARHGKISFSGQASSPKTGQLEADGEVNSDGSGEIFIDLQDLKTDKLITAAADNMCQPGDQAANLNLAGKWQGKETWQLDVRGQLPDFFLLRRGKKQHFIPGQADIRLQQEGDRQRFAIKKLQFNEPAAKLSGEISHTGQGDDAIYNLDLGGQDIDVAGVREHILALLGDSEVATLALDIVRSGTAKSARFQFNDTLAAFANVTAMTIKVDVDDAWIHLGAIPLDLHHATGPIIIKDGILSGKGCVADVADSHGSDGSFLVGLADDEDGLEVDVLIDANLSELPATLRQLLPDKDVVRELGKVEGKGRATGRLTIGGTLDEYQVTVDVHAFAKAVARYDRLSWPLSVTKGKIQVSDSSATWQGINGILGLHQIHACDGNIQWDKAATPLTITALKGRLDLNTIYNEMVSHPVLHDFLSPVLSSIQGSAKIKGSMQGPFFQPEKWTYKADLELRDVDFSAPFLGDETSLASGQARLTERKISLASDKMLLMGEELGVNLTVNHKLWDDFSGELIVDGWLQGQHLAWLRQHDFIKTNTTLITPARLTDFHFNWNDKRTNIAGTIHSSKETTKASLALTVMDEGMEGSVSLDRQGEKALLAGSLIPRRNKYDLQFQGKLSQETMAELFQNLKYQASAISGDFQMQSWPDEQNGKQHFMFAGGLKVDGLQFPLGPKNILISSPHISLAGKGRELEVEQFSFRAKEKQISAGGSLKTTAGQGQIEAEVSSESELDKELLSELASAWHSYFPDKEKRMNFQLSGGIDFNLHHFSLNLAEDSPRQALLPFSPLQGRYTFNPEKSSLNLSKSQVCAMTVEGQMERRKDKTSKEDFRLYSEKGRPLDLKSFLNCLDMETSMDGPLVLNAKIAAESGLCKDGKVYLHSEEGSIKKMVVLAKVFSLINLTGLSGAIWHKGFYYHSFTIDGTICDNVLTIDTGLIDGDGVNIVIQGVVNLNKQEYDLNLFVVPFVAVNNIVTKVPLVGRILGGKAKRIISIPVQVSGPIRDPKVTILKPSAVTKATTKWLLETIILPLEWATN